MLSDLLSLVLAVTAVAAVAVVAVIEHRKQIGARRRLLDACASVLDDASVRYGRDGIPSLVGRVRGMRVSVELILDTMTIRRLPQLWLSVTLLTRREDLPGFAVLVRPAGTEFYSLTTYFKCRLDMPPGLPHEALIRGERIGAQRGLDVLAPTLAALFGDGLVKEVAVTALGVRVIRQAGEGKRGEHLLLRQATFEGAEVSAAALAAVVDDLLAINSVLAEAWTAPVPSRIGVA